MTLLKEPEFYLKDAKEFKTKLNISYELACADEFFSYLENLRALRLSGENDLFSVESLNPIYQR